MGHQNYRWSIDGQTFAATFEYTDEEYDHVCSLRHDISGGDVYEHYIRNDPYLQKVSDWIRSIADEHEDELPEFETEQALANYMLRFCHRLVQSIDYRKDRGEYPRYPSEMLMDGWGDCEDSAILLAALAMMLEYDCAFLSFDGSGIFGVGAWAHIDLGIAPNFPGEFCGCFWRDGDMRYYIAHANGSGDIGDNPAEKYHRAAVYPIVLRYDE